ncbi:hypothetical protein LZC95_49520 [Pendulispora brunnea]|uniref:Secreted protein n=1 Tax=Pendulispora brunnea TaxID=2905690 RepID=A0ABZ2KBL1_9BACT
MFKYAVWSIPLIALSVACGASNSKSSDVDRDGSAAGQRDGACIDDEDCQGLLYHCKCVRLMEVFGKDNTTCTDSRGGRPWCAPPKPLVDCNDFGGMDTSFGNNGCTSDVDP